jgi:hypothetical protein
MPTEQNRGERKPGGGLSQLPQQERRPVRKAPTPRSRRKAGAKEGPGGLGYVLGLDDDEQSEIDLHATETEPKAPPSRSPRKR